MKIIQDIKNPHGVNKFYPCKQFCLFVFWKSTEAFNCGYFVKTDWRLGAGRERDFSFYTCNFSVFLNVSHLLFFFFLSGNQI